MDLTTLGLAYAFVQFARAAALIITWLQHRTEPGPGSWAISSVLGAAAVLLIATTGLRPQLMWLTGLGYVAAISGAAYFALGTRQYVNRAEAPPRWLVALVVAGAAAIALTLLLAWYPKTVMVAVGSLLIAFFSFDLVFTLMRRRETRSAPAYFLAFFFAQFGGVNAVRSITTLLDPGHEFYSGPLEIVLVIVGTVGAAGTAMGFAMLTTARLLAERKHNFDQLEAAVEVISSRGSRGETTGSARGRAGRAARWTCWRASSTRRPSRWARPSPSSIASAAR
jgi:hypothetical protein